MDSQAAAMKPSGLTPAKAAIIAFLGVVLVVVLFVQYGDWGVETAGPIPRDVPARRPASARSSADKARSAPNGESVVRSDARADRPDWPTVDLTQAVEFDPFALPPAFPQPEATIVSAGALDDGVANLSGVEIEQDTLPQKRHKIEMELEQLRQQGVRVIVTQRDQFVAMIGDRTVHVGDEIDGFKVIAIDPSGVHVEKDVQK